ncbi:putative reverse transcriptase domain-containing protein [Tanacetum coccineum]
MLSFMGLKPVMMSADVFSFFDGCHGGDGGGDDRPPPYQTQFDLRPHMESDRWPQSDAGIQQPAKDLLWQEAALKEDIGFLRAGLMTWSASDATSSHISEVNWDAQLAFWNDPKNLARAAQNKQNRAKSKVMETSATREYPSLIHTFFLTHTVGGVFLNPEDKALYDEMLRLQGLGSNTPTGVPYTEDEIMAIVSGASSGGTFSVLDGVLPRTARSDDKFSQMLNQFESQPEYGGGSGSGGCGDDEPGDDEDGGEDEDDNMLSIEFDLYLRTKEVCDFWARRCRPGTCRPGNESQFELFVPLIPGDMSPGKGSLSYCYMAIVKFHCSFVGLNGCNDGGGNGLTRAYLITHLRDRHCSGEVQAITKNSLLTDLVVFERAEVTLKRMGIWPCGVCFKTHTLCAKCRHGADIVPPPDIGDGVVRFVIYDLTKPLAPSCSQLDHVDGLLLDQHDGFTLSLLDSLLLKGLRTVKSIPLKCRLSFSRVLKGALDKEKSIINAIRSWGVSGGSLQLMNETLAESSPLMLDVDEGDLDLSEQNLKKCKRKICDGHYTVAVRVLSFSSVAPNNDATLQELKAKHSFTSAPSLPDIPMITSHHLHTLRGCWKVKSFSSEVTSCGIGNGLRMPTPPFMDCISGAAVAILLTLALSGGAGSGTVWRCLVSKVSATMIGHSLDGLQFGVGVPGGGEAILHAVNRLVEDRGDDVGLSMLLVDFQNVFNLVDRTVMLEEVRLRCPAISRWVEFCYSSPARLYYGEHSTWSGQEVQQGDPLGPPLFSLVLHPQICKIRDSFNLCLRAWYLDDGTIVGDTLVVGKVLELITEDGPRCGLHLNVDKTKLFWPKEDPRSRLEGVFPPNISRPLYGVKLLGGPVSVDADFSSALVTKRVSKTIRLLDTIAKINDPQCELLLIRACAGISKLYFAMHTCPLVSLSRLNFLLTWLFVLPWSVLSRLLDRGLATGNGDSPLYRLHLGGLAFIQQVITMEIDFQSNPSEVTAPKLMKKMADIYFTRVTKDAESSFSLSPRQMALWLSQREEHTSDWLRVVSISGLGQTMNGKTYRCVMCYRLGVPLFAISKPCSAYSKVFTGDVYGDHVVSCAGVIGIKHRHNAVRDTLVDICFRSGISAGKEVDIGLGGGCDKALRPADMLLYSWDGGLDVCVDLTGSSHLTQTGMADFVPGQVVLDAAQRKRGKYMTKCATIGYGFLPFSFSSLWELEANAVTLLKRIRKFSVAQDIGACATIHIFNRIGFSIGKGVKAQIVSRLPSNLL